MSDTTSIDVKELDKRYVKKSDLDGNVKKILEANTSFVTKDELQEVASEFSAVKYELQKNTEVLNKIYDISAETKEQQRIQKNEILTMTEEFNKAKKNLLSQVWSSLPLVIRAIISFLIIFITLITASMMIGQEADSFMRENGLFVTMFTGATSIVVAKIGGDKK